MMNEDIERRAEPGAVVALLALMNGPVIWSLHLAAVYFTQSLTCTLMRDEAAVRPVVVAEITIATAVALAALWYFTFSRDTWRGTAPVTGRFLQRATVVLSALSAFAILAAAATILLLPPCAELR